ncbi:hypothetical protein BC834DRAFT_122402 [Gloeopeniophorella convolvens]|nr:hypothetical protein BC834DRAFT_122402 [Gloeopeniophorella convolvens]
MPGLPRPIHSWAQASPHLARPFMYVLSRALQSPTQITYDALMMHAAPPKAHTYTPPEPSYKQQPPYLTCSADRLCPAASPSPTTPALVTQHAPHKIALCQGLVSPRTGTSTGAAADSTPDSLARAPRAAPRSRGDRSTRGLRVATTAATAKSPRTHASPPRVCRIFPGRGDDAWRAVAPVRVYAHCPRRSGLHRHRHRSVQYDGARGVVHMSMSTLAACAGCALQRGCAHILYVRIINLQSPRA